MPQNRKITKTPLGITKHNTPRKLRIGTRSSGLGGHTMSNKSLHKVLDDKSQKRYHARARAVLATRGHLCGETL